ncbi:MAG: ribose-5-phosphate isomerase RpiA [Hyphomicrobium sp.]
MTLDIMKIAAAERALTYVVPGMTLGLGTGSTSAYFVDLLAKKIQTGLKVLCVPTSEKTKIQAEKHRIPLTTLEDVPFLDLTVDGADEIDKDLRLIKGGGGALLREKIVATASDRMVVIADETKLVQNLGAFPLPVEVVQFGLKSTLNMIEMLASDAGCQGEIRLRVNADGTPFCTDSGNYLIDCAFGHIKDPESLDEALKFVPGVVENGLFLGVADLVIIGSPQGIKELHSSYNSETSLH